MNINRKPHKFLTSLLALLALCSSAYAQSSAKGAVPSHSEVASVAPESSADTPNRDDEALTLSAFEVTTDKSNDYVASESVTGTRVVSKLRDLPFQVNVITNEFLMDFSAYDMSQQLGFVSNVSPSDSQGSFTLRGFASTPFVDGFRRTTAIDISNTARIEIVKGPSASIYGQTLPGGVVNYISKRPTAQPTQEIDAGFGSYRFMRGAVSSSGPVGSSKHFFYLADISDTQREFSQAFASQHTTYGTAVFEYKADDGTTVMFKVDDNKSHNHDRTAIPWIKSSTKGNLTKSDGTALTYSYLDSTGKVKTANAPFPQVINRFATSPGDVTTYLAYIANPSAATTPLSAQLQTTNSWDQLAYNLANVRSDGPLGFTDTNLRSASVTAEHRYNDVFSTRATIDTYDRKYKRQSESGNQVYYTDPNYLDGELGLATPTWTLQPRKGYSGQWDNLAAFKTGPINHKLLVTFDFARTQQGNTTLSALSSGTNAITGAAITDNYLVTDPITGIKYPFVLPLGPRSIGPNGGATPELTFPLIDASYSYPTYDQHPEMYNQLKTSNWSSSDDYGLFVSERASFFKDRVIALIGERYDNMKNLVDNYLAAPTDPSREARWNNHAFTHQLGLTAYATKNVVFFANDSTTYNPNPQIVTVNNGDGTYSIKTLPNETGSGYEFGVRFNFFNNRFNIGLSRFDIDRKNKVDSFTNEFGITEYVGSGEQRSKGYEIDFNWSVTDALQLIGGYGFNDARYVHSSLPYLVGTGTPQNAKDNANVALRYQIKNGALKGLSFVAGMRYYSRSLISVGSGGVITTNPYATSGFKPAVYNVPLYNGTLPFPDLPGGLAILSRNDTATTDPAAANPSTGTLGLKNTNVNKGYTAAPTGWVLYTPGTAMNANTQYYIWDGDGTTNASYTRTTSVDDGRSNVFNEPYAIWNFGLNYTLRESKHVSHTFRVSLNNAFNRFYTYGNAVYGFPREYQFTYSIGF